MKEHLLIAWKERPILFNGDMVRAILEGRKTQTRRVIKPQPPKGTDGVIFNSSAFEPDYGFYFKPHGGKYKCPYGVPGDRLWVREAFCHLTVSNYDCPGQVYEQRVLYRADEKEIEKELGHIKNGRGKRLVDDIKWKPSIHLKCEHSRILLEITDIRVERVQDITRDDATAEGHPFTKPEHPEIKWNFQKLWNSINEKKGFGWDMNPWVWVIEFKEIKE